MLLSYLTARDCEIITTQKLITVIERVIAVVETLPKFHGNLYNWYDTASLSILPPGFVSTVDSGNLACCFVALREGIIDYREEDKRAGKLIEKIDRLIEETDLSVFYDAHKDLFSIGWDSAARQMSGSHYDMLMSEEMCIRDSLVDVWHRRLPVQG